jgi:hypothetical protein
MNKELKAKWVEALRSGKYKQGKGMLRNEKGQFCCLGVLCDITNVELITLMNGLSESVFYYNGNPSFLTTKHLQEISLDGSQQNVLIDMNDQGICFDAIADYIETNF